jgi:hypothetical protein
LNAIRFAVSAIKSEEMSPDTILQKMQDASVIVFSLVLASSSSNFPASLECKKPRLHLPWKFLGFHFLS